MYPAWQIFQLLSHADRIPDLEYCSHFTPIPHERFWASLINPSTAALLAASLACCIISSIHYRSFNSIHVEDQTQGTVTAAQNHLFLSSAQACPRIPVPIAPSLLVFIHSTNPSKICSSVPSYCYQPLGLSFPRVFPSSSCRAL